MPMLFAAVVAVGLIAAVADRPTRAQATRPTTAPEGVRTAGSASTQLAAAPATEPATASASAAATQPGATTLPSATVAQNPSTAPSTQPGATQPGAIQAGATQPATTQPGGVAAGGVATTQPATTQPGGVAAGETAATQPTTRPLDAATVEQIRKLVAQLESPDWRRRDRAVPELVKLGDDARPALEELVRTTEVIDARTAAQDALNQIAANRLTGPSYVTLHLKDALPRDAFAELARQSFAELKPYPDNLWESGGQWQKVTIDVDRVPFWVAMRDLAGKSGVELREWNGGMRLMRGGGVMAGGRPVYTGAFLIVANSLTRNQTVQLTNNGAGKTDDNFGLQLTAFAEPKLHVLRAGNMVKLEEATDDKGNSLLPGPNAAPRYYGYYSGAGAWHLFANLQYPKEPGTKITRLRASATFTVQTKSQKIEVNNLPGVKEHVEAAGGTRVTIHEFKKAGDSQYQLRIAIGQDAAGNGLWELMQNSIHTRLRVLDAAGRTWDSRGWSTTSNNTELSMEITYVRGNSPDGHPVGDPVKLEWEIPTDTRDLTVPFEFTDVPLPQ
jgi:hypothetical protein